MMYYHRGTSDKKYSRNVFLRWAHKNAIFRQQILYFITENCIRNARVIQNSHKTSKFEVSAMLANFVYYIYLFIIIDVL
jgi:hypothetical protein